MLYALILNTPLINVIVRLIKPNKLVMLYERSGEIDHLKNKNMIIV